MSQACTERSRSINTDNKRKNLCKSVLSVVLILLTGCQSPVSFNEEIRPIFNQKCISCHGGVKKQGGFSLLFREEALAATESGVPAIIPGDPDASELMKRLRHSDPELRMPYEHEPLPDEEVELIAEWIKQGAKWDLPWSFKPPDQKIKPPDVSSSWIENDIDRFIFSRLKKEGLSPAPKAEKAALLRRLSLDLTGLPPDHRFANSFINHEDEAGIPENPRHASSYFKDGYEHEYPYESAVISLLNSPHFGERWASMWLDLARYADSRGYEKDMNRSIWQYRDWVIRAFNEDMPFDQFTIEQLAGDLLPNPTQDQYLATAFHRNTMANDEGGTNDEEFRVAAVIDRVGTTYEVWQGITMACVQCHSHPYDPITHEDFYKTYAFFNNTADKDIYNEKPRLAVYTKKDQKEVEEIMEWVLENTEYPESLEGEFLHDKKQDLLVKLGRRKVEAEEYDGASRFIELNIPEQGSVSQIQDSSWIMFEEVPLDFITEIGFLYATPSSGGFVEICLSEPWKNKIGGAKLSKTGSFSNWKEAKAKIEGSFSKWEEARAKTEIIEEYRDIFFCFRRNKDREQELFRLDKLFFHYGRKPLPKEVEVKLDRLEAIYPIETPIMRELPENKRRKNFLFERGNWLSPGKEVMPGVPGALWNENGNENEIYPEYSRRNENFRTRLDLTQWLVSPENPLTARVIVNRFWEQIFGTGLVKTLEDFGSQGDKPSHPELLDWLANRFVHIHKWKIKPLLKDIVMSATYQQSSVSSPEKIEVDPNNRLLSRGPRIRLSSEQIRDQVLAVSGLLKHEMHGPPVMLAQPDKRVPDAFKQNQYIEYDPFRRGIYGFWKRTNPNPVMVSFDSPTRNVCTSRRIRTNTPLQALILMNDSVYFKAAQAIASKMMENENKIGVGYWYVMRLGYGNIVNHDSLKFQVLNDLYSESLVYYKDHPEVLEEMKIYDPMVNKTPEFAALTIVANAMLNMDEFITK